MIILDFLKVMTQDLSDIIFNRKGSVSNDDDHLEAAVSWLKSAYDHSPQGFSKAYKMVKGWMPAYPETSGYIIGTYLHLYKLWKDPSFLTDAYDTGKWLVSIQLENGGIVGRELGVLSTPIDFDTGQVLHGFVDLIEHGYADEFTLPACQAGYFLKNCQDETGCFVRNTSLGLIHTYNVRSAWAMIRAGTVLNLPELIEAGQKNVDWTLTQQLPNGFFLNNNFKTTKNTNTHAIGYTHRGILESYFLLKDPRYLEAVIKGADKIVALLRQSSYIPANIGENWEYLSFHLCLTGYAQNAIVLMRLWQITQNTQYLETAYHLIECVKAKQDIVSKSSGIYGGVRGSFPIWGNYAPMQYPNWATKFFVDALLLKKDIRHSQ